LRKVEKVGNDDVPNDVSNKVPNEVPNVVPNDEKVDSKDNPMSENKNPLLNKSIFDFGSDYSTDSSESDSSESDSSESDDEDILSTCNRLLFNTF